MTKEIKRKLTLDAGNSPAEVKKVQTSLEKLNEVVRDGVKASKESTRELNRTTKIFETAKERTKLLNTATLRTKTTMLKFRDSVKEVKGATEFAWKNIAKLGTAALATSAHISDSRKNIKAFRTQLDLTADSLSKERQKIQSVNRSLGSFNMIITNIVANMKAKNNTLLAQTKATEREATAVKKLADQMNILGGVASRVRIVFTSFVLYRGFTILSQQIRASVTAAKEWAKAISEIRTISERFEQTLQSTGRTTAQWQEELVGVSNAFGIDVVESAEGAYQSLSNQVTEAANTTKFLREEVKLAITAVSSLDEAVSATTAIMNAFGEDASTASRINAILFKTVEEGRLRLSELSNTIGRVSILSDQLGISFLEQQASLTLLTRKGIQASEAITLLRNVQLKLIKPSERMKDVFREWGVESGEAAIRAFGFVGVIQKLREDYATLQVEIENNNQDVIQALKIIKNAQILIHSEKKNQKKRLFESIGSDWKITSKKLDYEPHYVSRAVLKTKEFFRRKKDVFEPLLSTINNDTTLSHKEVITVWYPLWKFIKNSKK